MAIVALGLHVKEMTDSGFAVAALSVCLFGPSVVVAEYVGLLVAPLEATQLLAAVSALGAAAAAALAFSTGLLPVLVLTTLLGAVFATSQSASPTATRRPARATASPYSPATGCSPS